MSVFTDVKTKMKCKEAVFTVLEGLNHPVRSGEARDLVTSRFPLVSFGINSVPATLSMLAHRKKIGRCKMPDGSFGYYALGRHGDLSDAVSVGRPVADLAQRDPNEAITYKASVAIPVANAIAAWIGTDDDAHTRNLASQSLDSFCHEKPWLEKGFFWVCCRGARPVSISVSVSSTKTPMSYIELRKMYQNKFWEFSSSLVMVRDKGKMSDAHVMKSSYFSTTAIIWYMINHFPEDFQRTDEVFQKFLAYARENYVNRSNGAEMNVVDAYVDIYRRMMEKKTRLDEDDATAAPDVNSVTHLEVADAMWTNDGLRVVLHIPHGIAEKLLRRST